MPILADYVWQTPIGLRWKTRVFHGAVKRTDDDKPVFPEWDFDGRSTGQVEPEKYSGCTEVRLRPVFVCDDPMRPGRTHARKGEDFCRGYIVLCDISYARVNANVIPGWHRPWAKLMMDDAKLLRPWFEIKQEFYIFDPRTRIPVGFPDNQHIRPQGSYFCRMGDNNGRALVEKHMEMCLSAGLKVSSMNANIGPSQWEYKIGPCEGNDAADQHTVSRYLMDRLAESFGMSVSWNPKPLLGNWNGSGCHIMYSTAYTRGEVDGVDSYEAIRATILQLETFHPTMEATFSKDNLNRLNGQLDTSLHNVFTWGIGSMNTSVRIPTTVFEAKKGCIEDRRPGADMDPYLTLATIVYADLNGFAKQKRRDSTNSTP